MPSPLPLERGPEEVDRPGSSPAGSVDGRSSEASSTFGGEPSENRYGCRPHDQMGMEGQARPPGEYLPSCVRQVCTVPLRPCGRTSGVLVQVSSPRDDVHAYDRASLWRTRGGASACLGLLVGTAPVQSGETLCLNAVRSIHRPGTGGKTTTTGTPELETRAGDQLLSCWYVQSWSSDTPASGEPRTRRRGPASSSEVSPAARLSRGRAGNNQGRSPGTRCRDYAL